MLVLQKGLILPVPMYGGSYFFIQPFKKIADELGKSPSSVSREVRRHLIFSPHYYDDRSRRKTECIYFSSCSKQGVCGNLSCSSLCSKCRSRKCASFCPSFTTAKCELLKKTSFLFNFEYEKSSRS